MKISEIVKNNSFLMSAEVFPPKTTGTMETVIRALRGIKDLNPDYVSVTCRNGEGVAATADVASIAIDALDLNTVAHLTAVNTTVDGLEKQIAILKNKKIENVLVLRGDIIENSKFYDFKHATDLAKYMSEHHPEFNLVGACYAEGHVESESLDEDLNYIKMKVECGVKQLITQLFFSNDTFYRFMDNAHKKGIDVPVFAGVMPITSETQINRIVKLCGVEIPSDFAKLVATYRGNDLFEAGTDYAISQIEDLNRHGVSGVHLYTMNKADVAKKVFGELDVVRKNQVKTALSRF